LQRKILMATVAVALVASAAACSSSSSKSASTSASASASASTGAASGSSGGIPSTPVTLTLWHNYGTEQNATATKNLVDAYQTLHPNVTIKIVSQPADNYFSLLQASAVSKTGPDVAVMWTGLFTLQYKSFLTGLKGLVPDAALAKAQGLRWTTENFDPNGNPYVMPLETQFYIGFYNKADFAKAGVTSVPTTWDELYAASAKLKAAGFTPLVYGNGGQSLGAEFYPWYDASYAAIGQLPVDQLRNIYDGKTAWNSPGQIAAYTKWAALESKGYTNSDILTKTNNLDDFLSGKAAMIVDGTWDTQKFTDAMKDNVAAFVPPFSDTPIKGVVDFPGDGFAITSYSKHKDVAGDFLGFITSAAGQAAINAAGLIPDVAGATTSNPVNQQMLDFVSKGGMTPYPMLDNVVQGDIVDAGNKILPSILAGKISPDSGLGQLQSTWQQLTADKRSDVYK
jgi:ABC-type glycerol-3-phosphate transport system substrate-binding protein